MLVLVRKRYVELKNEWRFEKVRKKNGVDRKYLNVAVEELKQRIHANRKQG